MKKGFTLVELLAVIAILGVIMSITFLSVSTILKNSKESLSNSQKANIEEVAKTYYLKEGMLEDNSCINLSELIDRGYLEVSEVRNPKTKEVMDGSVVIIQENNQYTYRYRDTKCTTN